MQKVTPRDLNKVSALVKNGFITEDYLFGGSYITIRTLHKTEKEEVLTKYSRTNKMYNFLLILEILSFAIYRVGGIKIDNRKKMYNLLSKMPSQIVIDMYTKYNELNATIDDVTTPIEIWSETSDSRNYWQLFKRISMPEYFLKKTNEFQYYWMFINEQHDLMEEEKRSWTKVEYMTNSICAFTNPKAYKQNKSRMNVSDSMSKVYDERIEKRRLMLEKMDVEGEVNVDDLENEQPVNENGFTIADAEMFDSLRRKQGETQQQFNDRVNEGMKKHISGIAIDDHDEVVKSHEKDLLKRLLLEERVRREAYKEMAKRKKSYTEDDLSKISADGVFHEDDDMLGDDIVEDVVKGPWAFNDIDYAFIIREKAFMGLRKDEKQAVFDEIIKVEIDVEKAIENIKNGVVQKGVITPIKATETPVLGEIIEEDTKTMDIKNMAAKAAKMDLNIAPKDLVNEKRAKVAQVRDKLVGKLDIRNEALGLIQEDDTDMMVI